MSAPRSRPRCRRCDKLSDYAIRRGLCRDCTEFYQTGEETGSLALAGGTWVNDKGVQRWVPDPVEPVSDDPLVVSFLAEVS